MQHTLRQKVTINGIGLHTGKPVTMSISPAAADSGIVFERIDAAGLTKAERSIPAKWDKVADTRLCTVIANDKGLSVGTIEHLMAALRAAGIDNAHIEIDAPEVPILDGSSKIFMDKFAAAGTQAQTAPRRALRITKKITVKEGDKEVSLSPSMMPVYKGRIDFDHPTIGTQHYEITLVNGNFKHDLADCRTFCFLKDVEMLRANGLALGGSLDNAIVVDDAGVMNEDGLRCRDEFIRHKLLDAIGDLALCGGLLLGTYEGARAGHDMNNKLLHALFADESAWEIIDLYADLESVDELVYRPAAAQNVPLAERLRA
jgi:UDP-3-O-[3-hydroxymyristoyl] N-acetylglucosamine deacetylase